MDTLLENEILSIDGGRLKSLSDWMLLGSGICFCFCAPAIGQLLTIL